MQKGATLNATTRLVPGTMEIVSHLLVLFGIEELPITHCASLLQTNMRIVDFMGENERKGVIHLNLH